MGRSGRLEVDWPALAVGIVAVPVVVEDDGQQLVGACHYHI